MLVKHSPHPLQQEMPTGTGKTVSLLSLITSYQFAQPEPVKLIYCTRTVPEISQCLAELKRVIAYRTSQVGAAGNNVLAVCLSSRRNMCVHERVAEESERESVDSACMRLTASWVRERAREGHEVETCSFYETYDREGSDTVVGVSCCQH